MAIKKISMKCNFCGGWTNIIGSKTTSLCPTCNVSFRKFNVANEVKKHGKRSKDAYAIARRISKAHGRPTPSQELIKQVTELI